jgi:hypothetical protein
LALDLSQLCILPARQSYIRQYGKIRPYRLQILQQLKPTDEVKRHDFCCNFLGNLADDDTKVVLSDEAACYLSGLRPMDFFLWGFMKDSVYARPLPTTLHDLKTRIREACENTDQEILLTCVRRLDISLMLLEPLVALTLFLKLFKLVFHVVRVL